jgi:hypothetical protein
MKIIVVGYASKLPWSFSVHSIAIILISGAVSSFLGLPNSEKYLGNSAGAVQIDVIAYLA